MEARGRAHGRHSEAYLNFSSLNKIWLQARKRKKLKRLGLAPPGDKVSLREAAIEACANHPIKQLPMARGSAATEILDQLSEIRCGHDL